jgi:hypothetical protein
MSGMSADALAQLRLECSKIGFDLDQAGSSLVERMRLLADCSKTFDDAQRMASHANRVFDYYDIAKPTKAFDSTERQTVVLACLFSDIGKSGPEHADADARRVVAESFAVENVPDDKQSVEDFLRRYFPGDAEQRGARLAALGVDTTLSMREFWNLHSGWTLAIAEAAGLPAEAVAAAATHHLLEDVNPQAIVGEDDVFTRRFGQNATFDRAEKLVILLDKYDAVRRRGGRSHDETIAWLRDRIAKSPRFARDPEFAELLADLEVVLAA